MTVAPPTVHATAVALGGRCVLLLGASGTGKSDLALRLIDRGWRLVADDHVVLAQEKGVLWASAPPQLAGLIEVRGVGIVPEPALARAPVVLALDLATSPDRLPDPARRDLAGVAIPWLGFDGCGDSAPQRVERALRVHGLRLSTATVIDHLSESPPTPPSLASFPMLIISGMSGAGKSTALKALEDLDYEAVDNMPLGLVETLLASAKAGDGSLRPLLGEEGRLQRSRVPACSCRTWSVSVRVTRTNCSSIMMPREGSVPGWPYRRSISRMRQRGAEFAQKPVR